MSTKDNTGPFFTAPLNKAWEKYVQPYQAGGKTIRPENGFVTGGEVLLIVFADGTFTGHYILEVNGDELGICKSIEPIEGSPALPFEASRFRYGLAYAMLDAGLITSDERDEEEDAEHREASREQWEGKPCMELGCTASAYTTTHHPVCEKHYHEWRAKRGRQQDVRARQE